MDRITDANNLKNIEKLIPKLPKNTQTRNKVQGMPKTDKSGH